MNEEKLMLITEAAEIAHVSRQAIYIAIKKGRLAAEQQGRFWFVRLSDLNAYRALKHCRLFTKYQGEPLYDIEKGEFSPHIAAKYLGVLPNKIYYLIGKGALRTFRRGHHYILLKEDLDDYAKGEKERKDADQLRFA